MPSVEYTQSKGLIQKNSQLATLDLQGELFGHRKNISSLGNDTHQLTVADSGKEYLITGTGAVSILLPPAKGVATDMQFTAGNVLTAGIGQKFLFDAFTRKFRLQVVAEAGEVANGAVITTDANGIITYALKDGAGGGAALAGTNLHTVLTTLLGDVATLGAAGAAFTITSKTVGAAFNGTITKNDGAVAAVNDDVVADLGVTQLPVHGADAIADAKGTKLRFVVNANLAGAVTIAIPVNNAATANGAFIGHVTRPAAVTAAAADTMTFDNTKDTLGDYYEFTCDGPTTGNWYVSGFASNAAASVAFA